MKKKFETRENGRCKALIQKCHDKIDKKKFN